MEIPVETVKGNILCHKGGIAFVLSLLKKKRVVKSCEGSAAQVL